MSSRLTTDILDIESLLTQTEDPESGALIVFGGTVRLDEGVVPVPGMFFLPTRHAGLERVYRPARGLECRPAMTGAHHHQHR